MGFFDFFRTKKADAKRDTSGDASGSMATSHSGDEKDAVSESAEIGFDSSGSDGGGGDGGGGGGGD